MTALDVATWYAQRGWSVVPIAYRDKKCLVPGWQQLRLTVADLPGYFNGQPQNVGVLLGEPSGGLVDVDLDCREAVRAASLLLPPTGSVFGRAGNPASHRLYLPTPLLPTRKFQDVDGKMLAEIRGTNAQTVFPGSTHEEGESIEWELDEEPAAVDGNELSVAVARVAAAALLARQWPDQGGRHHAALALSAVLLRGGWAVEDAERFVRAVALAAGDEEVEDRVRTVRDTAAALRSGDKTTGWPTLAKALDDKVLRRFREWLGLVDVPLISSPQNRAADAAEVVAATPAWGDPIPLDEKPVPPLPAGVFCGWFGEMIHAVARATETPPELAATFGLAAVSAVVQRKFSVRPEPGYFEALCVWPVAIMLSGNRKTGAMQPMIEPLISWERRQAAAYVEKIKEAQSQRKTMESRIEQLRSLAKKQSGEAFAKATQEIAELEASLPEVPCVPRLFTSDCTTEHLGTLMADNGERLAVISDEAGIFDVMGGRYSNGIANIDLYLQGHSGSPVRVDRVSRPAVHLDHPALTIGLSPQPSVITGITRHETFRGRGLLARFLYCVPPSRLGYRTLEQHPVPEELNQCYGEYVAALADVPPRVEGEREVPYVLRFSEPAWAAWKAFQREVEVMLREGQRLGHLTDWGSKLPGAVARLAGLLHCVDYASCIAETREVHEGTVLRAVELGRYYLEHALVAFDLMGADPGLDAAKRLWKVITSRRLAEFTARDAWHPLRGSMKRVADADPGFAVLVDHSYIAEAASADHGKPGRPSRRFRVNPAVVEGWR